MRWLRLATTAAMTALALPGLALAQDAVSHSVTTLPFGTQMDLTKARTLMPTVDVKRLPVELLLQHNHASGGGVPGAISPGFSTQAYGSGSPTSIMPYTFQQVFDGNYATSYPERAAGQLSFNIGSSGYVCSASMIRPGILVTAAHCVFNYGTNSASGWYSNWVFYPARTGGTNPYGTWTARQVWIPTVYYNGTDNCSQRGVICNNDLAVIIMNPNGQGKLPGNVVGYYGYGWNGYSFVSSFGGATLGHISQLGYPCAWDNCRTMERNDGVSSFWSPNAGGKQTLLGSAMTGGSSGGPWLVNLGIAPALTGSASYGNAANYDVVVAVTGWGYTTVGVNTQGASWWGQNAQFPGASYTDKYGRNWGAGNIGDMVSLACSAAPAQAYC